VIVILQRHHGNGRRAEVRLLEDGSYYSSFAGYPGEALATKRRSMNRSLERARVAADQYAHPGCDGRECGAWHLVASAKDDPILLHRLYPDAIDSAGMVQHVANCPRQHGTAVRFTPIEWMDKLNKRTLQVACTECGTSFLLTDAECCALLEEFRRRGF
jgi:hypothetical protein